MRKTLAAISMAAVMVTLCGGSAVAGQNMTASFNSIKLGVNKSESLTAVSAYKMNSEQYVRLNEFCQAVGFNAFQGDIQNAAWINTDMGCNNSGGFLCPYQRVITVAPMNITLYCDNLLCGNVPGFTVEGDLYIRIGDIVNATWKAANYFDTTGKTLPRIITLNSTEIITPAAPAANSGRYLTMYYNKAANVFQLSVIYKAPAVYSIPFYDSSGGKQFIPLYPDMPRTIPLLIN